MQAALRESRQLQGKDIYHYREPVAARTAAARTGERRASPLQKSIRIELQDRKRAQHKPLQDRKRAQQTPQEVRVRGTSKPGELVAAGRPVRQRKCGAQGTTKTAGEVNERNKKNATKCSRAKGQGAPLSNSNLAYTKGKYFATPFRDILASPVTAARYPDQKENY
ncbi:hypothetical protein HPB48_012319 [Haemaphysalis longicornis]|uniref:Uncharacterized protein n=1 Tax=Haemaphysalis longicornis TaxID=44386 RepID=A0A9J6GW36_HAELO|nr:hypothetical protein HPB48_012319 [Haemaphysalis longicornis]